MRKERLKEFLRIIIAENAEEIIFEEVSVNIKNKPEEIPWKYNYSKLPKIKDFDVIYMDGRIATKKDLISTFGLFADGKSFYTLKKSQRDFTDKLSYFKYSPDKYSKEIFCSILKKTNIQEKTCDEYYREYLKIIENQTTLSNIDALFKISNGKIEKQHAKFIDKYVHLVGSVIEDKKDIRGKISEEEINPDAVILPFYKNLDHLKSESLNMLFSKECKEGSGVDCLEPNAISGLASTEGLSLEGRLIEQAEKEIKIIKLIPICKRDDGVNVYYDLISGAVINDKRKQYGVITDKKTLYINSEFKQYVEHHRIEDANSQTKEFINDIKWEVCRVKPKPKLKLGPMPSPHGPICSSSIFKDTPYCQNIKKIEDFCKGNPNAPICAKPETIITEIKSGWDWMCNLEPFKSEAICGRRKKRQVVKKDEFDLPDSVHTWQEPKTIRLDESRKHQGGPPNMDIGQVTYEEEIFNKLKESGE